MATGIIAIAAKQQKHRLARRQSCTSSPPSPTSCSPCSFVIRLVVYPRLLVADLTSHAKGFAFLTIVAGTNVLASASAIIHGWWTLAEILWWCSLPLYVDPRLHRADLRRAPPRQARPRRRHQRLLVPAHRLHRIRRRARRAAPRPRPQRLPRLRLHRRVLPRPRPLPDRHDHGLPALDVPTARTHRSRPTRLDRRRRRRDHRPRRLQPARHPHASRLASTASPRSSKDSSRSPGPPPRSGSR